MTPNNPIQATESLGPHPFQPAVVETGERERFRPHRRKICHLLELVVCGQADGIAQCDVPRSDAVGLAQRAGIVALTAFLLNANTVWPPYLMFADGKIGAAGIAEGRFITRGAVGVGGDPMLERAEHGLTQQDTDVTYQFPAVPVFWPSLDPGPAVEGLPVLAGLRDRVAIAGQAADSGHVGTGRVRPDPIGRRGSGALAFRPGDQNEKSEEHGDEAALEHGPPSAPSGSAPKCDPGLCYNYHTILLGDVRMIPWEKTEEWDMSCEFLSEFDSLWFLTRCG